MFRKMAFVGMAVVAVACVVAGCAGPGGKGEGDSCGSQDDCSADLTCQPIDGRTGDYCCPAPADSSDKPNCQVQPDGG
jgi:predicted small secreted protein